MRSIFAALVTSSLALATFPAAAEVSAGEAHAELTKMHAELGAVYRSLPKAYGLDPAAEEKKIQDATTKFDAAKARLDPSLQSALETYNAVVGAVESVDRTLTGARLAVACSRAEFAVRSEHKQDLPASDQEMALFSDAVKALEGFGAPFTKVSIHFGGRLDALRAERAVIQAAAKKNNAAAAEAQRLKDLEAAMRVANRVRREAERLLAGETPLPNELVTSLTTTANKVHSIDAGAGAYYLGEVRRYERANGWLDADAEKGLGVVAGVLEGTPVDAGVTTRKRLSIRFDAKADECFAVFLRYKKLDAKVNVSGYQMNAAPGSLQRFDIPFRGVGFQRIDGACALANTKVAIKGVANPSKKNPLRFLVLSWPRAKVPPELAAEMQIRPPDPCDAGAWRSAWYTPVPGSLVYHRNSPRLVVRAGLAGEDTVSLFTPASDEVVKAKKSELTAAPKDKVDVDLKLNIRTCAIPAADSSGDRLALYQCHARIDKKFASKLKRAERKLSRAKSDRSKDRAEQALEKLRATIVSSRDTTCGPLAESLRQQARLVVDEILDRYATNAPKDVIDRSALLRGNLVARPELR